MDQVVEIFIQLEKMIEYVLQFIGITIPKSENTEPSRYDEELVESLQDCDEESRFVKLKYAGVDTADHKYSEFYEEGVITDRILTEFILKMDSYKSTQQRQSTQFLDFLGDIGGFEGAIEMIFVVIGGYFSAKFMLLSIASTLFVRKKNKHELDSERANYEGGKPFVRADIPNQFTSINIGVMELIYDTFMTTILCCCTGSDCMKKCPFMLRQRTL